MKKSKMKVNKGYYYITPAILIVAFVMLFPLLYNITLSFFEKTIYSKSWSFVGIEQYKKLLKSATFCGALKNTLIWTFFSVLFQFAIGFLCAMLLSQDRVKHKTVIRCLIMLPWVLPSIIGSLTWKWMYHSDYGIINALLVNLGIVDSGIPWTGSKETALISAVIVNAWKMFPLVLLYIEAILQSVSKELKEAAVVDGAKGLHIFRVVTWPHIAPTCQSVILLLAIWTLNAFTFIYVLTGGGPGTSSQVLSMFIYKEAFQNFDFGMAATASTILFLIVSAFATIYILITSRGEE